MTVTSNGQLVTVNVTNPRSHKIITIVCHEGTVALDATDVVSGATTRTSISAVPASLAGNGVTAAELCGIGGAVFDGLPHGDKNLTVKIAP